MKVRVCRKSDVPENGNKSFTVQGEEILIVRSNGDFFGLEDSCSHTGLSLQGGIIDGYSIKCPHHGACFDVRTGEAVALPAIAPVERYELVIDGDEVFVELDGRSG